MLLTQTQALPAFPGAEGFGADTPGGRGGSVYHVTNLNDSGPGSLRTGVSSPNRTIVFDVSGTITLNSDLKITRNNITIAGQTAPGDGITLRGRSLLVQDTHDVIVRYLRCRPGDINCPTFQGDSFDVLHGTNVVVDHITASWSIDECLSPTWSSNVTIQWCIIGASLNCSCHIKGCHGYGTLMRYGNGRLTLHHNLYVHNQSRNPRLGDNIHLDFINNVVYDWGGAAGYNGEDSGDNPGGFTNGLNYVNNYLIAGPSTTSRKTTAFDSGVADANSCEIYQSGNVIDGNQNGVLDGTDTGWSMFGLPYRQMTSPFSAPPVTTDPAVVALDRVLAFVGASVARDAVDTTVVNDVRRQTGAIINSQTDQGGWPTLSSLPAPTDTDQDGIPDDWETAMNWSPTAANNNHVNADGYTDLEWYLNWLATPHAVCQRNGSTNVDLQTLTGNSSNLTFSVAAGSNGVVSLLSDGHTARFTATNDYSGLASFSFNAIESGRRVGFGPVPVSVLISTNNAAAANTPPVLSVISNKIILAGATLTFTNEATDAQSPPQTVTFSLLNAPSGASVDATNGVFSWRPTIAQSPSSNYLEIVATDDGTPSRSATQAFSVLVNLPTNPQVQPATVADGQIQLTVNGEAGPDYTVMVSSNLLNWETLFTTNSPTPPFTWTAPTQGNFHQRFYRIQLGP